LRRFTYRVKHFGGLSYYVAPDLNVKPRPLTTMHRWLGAPLVTQEGERFEGSFGQVQQVEQDGAVEGLASVGSGHGTLS